MCVCAVSYTHLDVYKRQLQLYVSWNAQKIKQTISNVCLGDFDYFLGKGCFDWWVSEWYCHNRNFTYVM